MALTANAGSGGESSFEQVPPGSYKAICYRLVDAGTAEEEYQGEVNKRHRLYIFWELPELKMDDDRPMSIFAGYTLSLNERSNLHRDICAWRNKPFTEAEKAEYDLTSLLGKGCKLNVGTTANGNAKVTSVNAMPTAFDEKEELRSLPTINEQEVFDLEEYCKEWEGNPSEITNKMLDLLDTLPNFIQWRVRGCDEVGKEQIEPCFEVSAAIARSKKPAAATGGLKDMAQKPKDAFEDFEEDVPF
tara:strand:+ start:516 stop:1250 length:735 start_codon:yes stop_codon:yes gene_type:complete